MYKTFPTFLGLLLGLVIIASVVGIEAQESNPHTVRTTKFTIQDVDASTAFYEDLVGMTELDRFEAGDSLVEPFMAFQDDGKRIGLLRFTEYENIQKSSHPVSVLVVPSLDTIIKRFNDANYPITQHIGVTSAGYGASEAGGVNTAIIHDPSGNGIELIETGGRATVAGARLIVTDRKEAEDFFVRIFDVTATERLQTDSYDEVVMDFGDGMFVALFEPTDEAPLPKSEHPVVAIYSTAADDVLERVKAEGLGVQEFGGFMFLAKDPSGNVIEVVRQRTP